MAAHYRLAVLELQLGNAAAAEHEAKAARAGGYDPEHTVPLLAQTYLAQQKYRMLESPRRGGGNSSSVGGISVAPNKFVQEAEQCARDRTRQPVRLCFMFRGRRVAEL